MAHTSLDKRKQTQSDGVCSELDTIETLDSNINKPNQEISQSPIDTPPELAEKYEFIREIGHGTQGRIYQARDVQRGEVVAIKQLQIGSISNWKEYELFQREASVL